MEIANKAAYRSIWVDKLTYSLVKAWAMWKKPPFKKPLLVKRALAVLVYCGGEYYAEHKNDRDFRYPDALQMKQRGRPLKPN